MEWMKTLIRDLVWIIFPGGLLVILIVWLLFGIILPLNHFELTQLNSIINNWAIFSILLIFSYIIGQILRLRQLEGIDKKCTSIYRKKKTKEYNKKTNTHLKIYELDEQFNSSKNSINEKENNYFKDESKFEELKKAYTDHYNKFILWEDFPYPYRITAWRYIYKHDDYNKFFKKYDMQGLTKGRTFFHFCKSVIFIYSNSFTEEVLQQESLVRFLSGIYHAIWLGKIFNIIVGIYHLILIILNFLDIHLFSNENVTYSWTIFFISFIIQIIFEIINIEIIRGLRFMRVKEIQLAYDGFYLICKKEGLDF